MNYQAFVFDFDGVLADSVEVKTVAFARLYSGHGERIVDEVVRFHRENGGMPRREKFIYYQETLLGEKATDEILDFLSIEFSKIVVKDIVAAQEIPGSVEFIRQVYGEVPLFIDSAAPDEELISIVEQRGLSPYFDAVLGSESTKIENLQRIIDENGFSAAKVLFFGDALSDYRAAKACGSDFIGIASHKDSPLMRKELEGRLFRDFYQVSRFLNIGVR